MSQDQILSFVLDGLEAYLELERELGVKAIEVDRALLTAAPAPKAEPVAQPMAPKPAPSAVAPRAEPSDATAANATAQKNEAQNE